MRPKPAAGLKQRRHMHTGLKQRMHMGVPIPNVQYAVTGVGDQSRDCAIDFPQLSLLQKQRSFRIHFWNGTDRYRLRHAARMPMCGTLKMLDIPVGTCCSGFRRPSLANETGMLRCLLHRHPYLYEGLGGNPPEGLTSLFSLLATNGPRNQTVKIEA